MSKKYKVGDQIQLETEIDSLILMELDTMIGGHTVLREMLRVIGEARRRMWVEVHIKYPGLEKWECTIDQVFQRVTVVRKRD